jgi:glycosyltransferase involved in cell wall biosynthesis
MKIVLLSDSPFVTSGLGRLTSYFLRMFPEIEWYVWGVNHDSFLLKGKSVRAVFDKTKFEGLEEMVSPKQFSDDVYGLKFLMEYIKQVQPDIFLTAIDFDRVLPIADEFKKYQATNKIKWVNYFPVDRTHYHHSENFAFKLPDINVSISKYGVDKMASIGVPKKSLKQIWHPIDIEEFPELQKEEVEEFKKKYFGEDYLKKFSVLTVNRSFARKDPVRLLRAFKEFYKNYQRSFLYMHGSPVTYEGVDLAEVIQFFDIPFEAVRFPIKNYNEVSGVKQSALNSIYRSFDVFTTASMGEGFGFTTVEAMLCEVPLVVPNNTTFPELVNDNGYLVDISDEVFLYGVYNHYWPTVDYKDLSNKLNYVRLNPEEASEKAKAARQWVIKNLSLEVIKEQWSQILK